MQLNFFEKTLVTGSTTLNDLLQITGYIDIEILSDSEEKALEKIKLFAKYGDYSKYHVGGDKWYQINSPSQKINVFSYYEKGNR